MKDHQDQRRWQDGSGQVSEASVLQLAQLGKKVVGFCLKAALGDLPGSPAPLLPFLSPSPVLPAIRFHGNQ